MTLKRPTSGSATMTVNLPPLIGHRGLAGLAPENTMPAFEAAARHGLQFVELDAKLCASGELIVLHDNDVKRTSNGRGRAQQLRYTELRKLDAGSWFAPAFRGTRIPLLIEVLDFCRTAQLGVNIELKPNRGDYAQTARVVAELLQRERLIGQLPLFISSFSIQSLRAARDCMPMLPRGLLMERRTTLRHILQRMQELDTCTFNYDRKLISAKRVQQLAARGIPTLIWTVNDVDEAKRLLALGVQSVFSDYPLML